MSKKTPLNSAIGGISSAVGKKFEDVALKYILKNIEKGGKILSQIILDFSTISKDGNMNVYEVKHYNESTNGYNKAMKSIEEFKFPKSINNYVIMSNEQNRTSHSNWIFVEKTTLNSNFKNWFMKTSDDVAMTFSGFDSYFSDWDVMGKIEDDRKTLTDDDFLENVYMLSGKDKESSIFWKYYIDPVEVLKIQKINKGDAITMLHRLDDDSLSDDELKLELMKIAFRRSK